MSNRKLRGNFTGGEKDINDFFSSLKLIAEAKGWKQDWLEIKPFGDFGPLHKLTFGFILDNETEG
jgi:hypothetical protein